MTVCPMAERNVGRPWTEEEDKLLTEAVAKHGEHDNWKTIALSVPGRTNKACRKRWLHSLTPNVKKTAWTPEEDKQLLELYDKYGSKWSTIAREIPGRTDDACSKRYREALDPNLKKDEWTPDEDRRLLEAYARLGGKWGQVGQEFGRGGLGCRNRWRLLERKKKSKTSRGTPSSSSLYIMDLPEPEFSLSQALHQDLSQEDPNGLRYCPPEAYAGFPAEETSGPEHSFRMPTPEDFRPVHAQVAPFQVSSTSSLSAALSDPPSLPQPLPPVATFQDDRSNSEPLPSLTSSPLFYDMLEVSQDDQMSLDELPEDLSHIFETYSPSSYNRNSYLANIREPGMHSSVSPISYPSDMSLPSDLGNGVHVDGSWKSPYPLSELYMSFELASALSPSDNQSSASSTPFHILSPLSTTSSPNRLPQELPVYDQPASGSLLFSNNRASISNLASPSQHVLALQQEPNDSNSQQTGHNSEQPNPIHHATRPITQSIRPISASISTSTRAVHQPMRRPRKITSKRLPKIPVVKPGSRLSSALTLSDPDLRPYACGLERCWPADASTSVACFATSKDLLDHTKEEHANDIPGDKPYRCSLTGCGKSWKSVNGLQYHLQISTAHFKHAISSTNFSSAMSTTSDDQTPAGSGTETDADDLERVFHCHHANCAKSYRQPSGLRYHLKHGHPQDMPAQLPTVPPALARHMSTKVKKKRKEPSPSESGD